MSPSPARVRQRANRVQGLGPLTGLAAGVGIGVLAGLARAAGYRSAPPIGALLTVLGALANGPMTVLGITDPRTWSRTDWISDLVPHAAYGVVVTATMDAFERRPGSADAAADANGARGARVHDPSALGDLHRAVRREPARRGPGRGHQLPPAVAADGAGSFRRADGGIRRAAVEQRLDGALGLAVQRPPVRG